MFGDIKKSVYLHYQINGVTNFKDCDMKNITIQYKPTTYMIVSVCDVMYLGNPP